MNYAVIENTPGYLPDDDDPPVFDQYAEALNYLVERRKEIMEADWAWDYPEDDPDMKRIEPEFMLEVSEIIEGGFYYEDKRKIHDLGRVVEIVPLEPEDD